MNDNLEQMALHLRHAHCGRLEMDILKGCRICGRRLIYQNANREWAAAEGAQRVSFHAAVHFVCSDNCLDQLGQQLAI